MLRHFFPYFTVDGPPRQRKRKVDKSPDFRDNGGKPVSSGRRAASGWSGHRTFRRGIQVRRPVPAEEEPKAEDTPGGGDSTLQPPASGREAKPPPVGAIRRFSLRCPAGRRSRPLARAIRRFRPPASGRMAKPPPRAGDSTLQPPASGRMAKPPPRRGRSDASASGVRPDGEAAPLRGRSDASASGVRPGGEAVPRRGRFNTKQGGRFGP